jgi:putative oxidoreductase
MKNDIGALVLRLTFGGILLAAHGMPKAMNYSALIGAFPDPIGLGSSASLLLTLFAEVVCAGLIVLGLFTRYATIPAFITMFVAAMVVHSADPFGKKELAVVYMLGFLAIFFIGPGYYSMDRIFRRVKD